MAVAHHGSFGSFHTSNLLEQLTCPEDQYKPPPLPVQFPAFTERASFGKEMKEKHFFLDKDWTFINHGAFGAVLKEANEAQRLWQTHCERQPVRFLDRELFPQLIYAVSRVAKFVGAAKTDVVFVQNATTAINAVVQSLVKTFQPEDSILMTTFTYGAVKNLLRSIGKERGIRIDEAVIDFPLVSKRHIVKLIEDAIRPDTKLVVVDHVPSAHAVVMPVKEIVTACHNRGVQVLVDAAHCLGSMPLNMKDIGADYYVANAHKWFCSPKGCALLYVDPAHHHVIHPLVISWGHGYGFNSEFGWTGMLDYCAYLSMHTVLDFWDLYGPDAIREYLYQTAKEAGKLLVKAWDTGLLDDPDFFAMMVVVRLPEGLVPAHAMPPPSKDRKNPAYEYKHAVLIQNTLHFDFKIEVPVKVIMGQLFVRISAHVYNTLSDYQHLADAISQIKSRTARLEANEVL